MWLNRFTANLRPMWRLYWDLQLVGELDSLPTEGGVLLTPNHASFLDPWFLTIVYPRPLYHLINRDWYEKSPFWHWFFKANGCVPVTPQDPDETIESVRRVLDAGHSMNVFPEGRISYDGKVQRFRSGTSWIAAVTGAPVVPIGIRGAYELCPRTSRVPRPGPVRLVVGKPMRFPGAPFDGNPPAREIVRFKNALRERVLELAGQSGPGDAPVEVDAESPRTASV